MNDLDQLAVLHGIQTDYIDIWGNRHPLEEETMRSLLEAMDVSVGDDEQVRQALEQARLRPWRRVLPPAVVVRQGDLRGGPLELPLVLEEGVTGPLSWRVTEEEGDGHQGQIDLAALEVLEQREVEGRALARRALPMGLDLPAGYHSLELMAGGEPLAVTALIVSPGRCYLPPALEQGGRVWGPAVQLYSLRSRRNWGLGDFSDLRALCEACPGWGAALVGLNPLHALFPHNPPHASPYCPSSRLMLNVMYLDVEVMEDLAECEEARRRVGSPELQQELTRLRGAELVDYGGVAAVKRPVLEALFASFCQRHLERDTPRAEAFRAFVDQGGRVLRLHALYEALQEHFFARDQALWGWPVWPEAYRDRRSDEVQRFEADHRDRVDFFLYLQWQADLQLSAVARRCEELGVAPGLYQDLSVSVDRAGSEIWSNRDVFAMEASVGAPPDALGPQGQNWGLPPMVPSRLTDAAYAPFIEILRHTMRHAGALRIDHVMGLMRLFWIPPGKTPADGAYVRYPLDDLLGIVALESQRNRCLVIGEDLGTVPDEVRQALAPAGVLSYRVLYFEREGDSFKGPDQYPRQALVTVTTHDLPTLTGFWSGEDLRVRDELKLYPSDEVRQEFISGRDKDRVQLLRALAQKGLLPDDADLDPAAWPEMTGELGRAVCRYLASAPSLVMAVQLEDVLGQQGQANLPGTTHKHPNWLRRLSMDLEDLLEDQQMTAMADALKDTRGT